MIRKIALAMAVTVMLGRMGLPAAAAETGMLRIMLEYEEPVNGGSVTLYYAAEPIEGGYRLEEQFGGGIIRREEACSPELARWLCDRVLTDGEKRTLDADGGAVFDGLQAGLYLVTQSEAPEGWSCVEAFLLPMPLDGEWEVLARPKLGALLTRSPETASPPALAYGAAGLALSGMGLCLCLKNIRKSRKTGKTP